MCNKSHQTEPGQRAQWMDPKTLGGVKSVPVMALRISVAAASLISREACSLYQAVCGVQIRLGASFRGPWAKLPNNKKVFFLKKKTKKKQFYDMTNIHVSLQRFGKQLEATSTPKKHPRNLWTLTNDVYSRTFRWGKGLEPPSVLCDLSVIAFKQRSMFTAQ